MYTTKNFKSKKELKQAVDAWNDYEYLSQEAHKRGDETTALKPMPVRYFQPGPFGGNEPQNGTVYVEGPHYPAPHRFYAACTVKDGVIVKVK